MLRIGCILTVIGLGTASWAPSFPVLVAGLAVWGLAVGAIDAGTNMQAVSVEARYARPLLPSFHGLWTLGGIVATLGAITAAGLPLRWALPPMLAIPLVVAFAPFLPRDVELPVLDRESAVPWRPILLVGAALVAFYMVDTAATT